MVQKNEFVVYVLYSEKHKKRYTVYTSDLISRFKSHNELSTKGFTIKYRPWKVLYVEFFETKTGAIAREKFLKSGIGRAWLNEELMQ